MEQKVCKGTNIAQQFLLSGEEHNLPIPYQQFKIVKTKIITKIEEDLNFLNLKCGINFQKICQDALRSNSEARPLLDPYFQRAPL
jgi:hypothetical protein